ncbi:MAG: pilus assembly protein PilP [Nitrospinales bacterium]
MKSTMFSGKNPMKSLNSKIRSLLLIIMLFGFGAVALVPEEAYSATGITAGKKKLMVSELMRLSGMGQSQKLANRDVPPAAFSDSSFLGTLDMQDEEKGLINSLYQKGFQSSLFYRGKSKYILDHFSESHIKTALKWFRSPAGRRAMQAEKQYASTIGDFQNLVAEISDNLPSKRRLVLADRIENARHKTDFDKNVRIAMLNTIDPLNERFQAASTRVMINKVKKGLEDQIRTNNLLYTLYVYKKLKNEDLASLANFYESPAGRWFNRVHFKGSLNGFEATNEKVSNRLKNILLSIDSGKADLEMAKEVFPPGFRFLIAKRQPPLFDEEGSGGVGELAKKRDPFVPLVVVSLDGDEPEQELDISGDDLEVLKEIPFGLYQRIKEMDPMLYQDLEFYSKLFNNKKGLDALSREDYINEIDNYKNLIEKANALMLEIIITPLQTDYSELVLSGFVWSAEENMALVETSDEKGHSVKEGTIIGPRFGVVESVDQEKVVVIERVRDYLGNIITKTVDMEFPDPSEE